jgi:hypothetical protein
MLIHGPKLTVEQMSVLLHSGMVSRCSRLGLVGAETTKKGYRTLVESRNAGVGENNDSVMGVLLEMWSGRRWKRPVAWSHDARSIVSTERGGADVQKIGLGEGIFWTF